jgi:seryl-tRNA synthetase
MNTETQCLTEIRLGIEGVKESLNSESLSSATIKDHLGTLISLITIINERILQSLSELSKVSLADNDHREKHLEIERNLSQNLSELKLLAVDVKEYRKDFKRLDAKTDKYDNKLTEVISVVTNLQDNLIRLSEDVRNFSVIIQTMNTNITNDLKDITIAKNGKTKSWVIIVAALLSSTGLFTLIQAVIKAWK